MEILLVRGFCEHDIDAIFHEELQALHYNKQGIISHTGNDWTYSGEKTYVISSGETLHTGNNKKSMKY